ncbi:Transketolase, pyrimidine binding domain-containing protein [Phakopsora pachyrhizi]|nr:Transketolase, pyrimidine binding domain-containing protein [Phakopsora pachyrhizi]
MKKPKIKALIQTLNTNFQLPVQPFRQMEYKDVLTQLFSSTFISTNSLLRLATLMSSDLSAEALAFRTILEEGYDIRLSGQDSGQGEFSQRHAPLTDQVVEGRTIVPLNQLSAKNSQPGNLEIVNSPLSKYAVLGFELGLSYLTSRLCLAFWEAQFGDFVNTA